MRRQIRPACGSLAALPMLRVLLGKVLTGEASSRRLERSGACGPLSPAPARRRTQARPRRLEALDAIHDARHDALVELALQHRVPESGIDVGVVVDHGSRSHGARACPSTRSGPERRWLAGGVSPRPLRGPRALWSARWSVRWTRSPGRVRVRARPCEAVAQCAPAGERTKPHRTPSRVPYPTMRPASSMLTLLRKLQPAIGCIRSSRK